MNWWRPFYHSSDIFPIQPSNMSEEGVDTDLVQMGALRKKVENLKNEMDTLKKKEPVQ